MTVPPESTASEADHLRCTFVLPDGQRCAHPRHGNGEKCFWHDAAADKSVEGTGKRLLELVEAGHHCNGFELAGIDLEHAHLAGVYLVGVNLSGAKLYSANLRGAHLFGANLGGANLFKARLQGANMRTADLTGANLLDAALGGTKLEGATLGPNNRVYNEEVARAAEREGGRAHAARMWQEAEEVYLSLGENFRQAGRGDAAGDMYYRHMVAHRKLLKRDTVEHWVSLFMDLLCGYGERPTRVVGAWILLIFVSSVFFYAFGIEGTEEALIPVDGQQVLTTRTVEVGHDPGAGLVDNLHAYGQCVYFSVITMTTTGYGDLTPNEATQAFAAVEAFLGVFLSAVFVMVFGRKMMRG